MHQCIHWCQEGDGEGYFEAGRRRYCLGLACRSRAPEGEFQFGALQDAQRAGGSGPIERHSRPH